MIRTTGLTKRFGRITAVDDVDLDVREGDVYGFLGANGSGKTTTVRMLLGLVLATSGSVELFGRRMPGAAREVLPDVGAIIEDPAAYPHLSGRANLALFDAMDRSGERSSRAGRVDDALDRVGLGDVDGRPVRAYSLGMRQRLGLANALLRSPRLLVLDEPTNGLDPQGIRDIRALLLELNRAGTTVFVSSHLLAEIEQMCTRVGVLHRGRLVLQDHLDDLRHVTGRVLLVTSQPDRAADRLGTRLEERDGRRLLVRADDVADLAAELVAAGVPVDELTPERRTLEQIVLEATRAADQGSGALASDDEPDPQPTGGAR
ncbi:MAG: ABC transporter ATP-binding protein [Nocardioides sp.]